MKLRDALLDAGITQWRKMAKYYNLHHLEFSSNRLYQGLLNSLRDPNKIYPILNSLSQAEQRLLKAITLAQSINYAFDYRHWRSYLNYFFNYQLEVLVELQNRGLIYLNKKRQYIIPIEIATNIINYISSDVNNKLEKSKVDSYMHTGGEIAIKDILRFLDTLHKKSIRITNNNSFYKIDYQKLSNQFSLEQDKTEFNIGNKLDFLYKYIINAELAIITNSELSLTKKGLTWYNEQATDIWHKLIKYWILKYPTDAATRVANSVLLGLLVTVVSPDITISYDKILAIYQSNGGIIPLNLKREQWLSNTINELVYLGILYDGVADEEIKVNKKFVKLFNYGQIENWMCENSFITQPNLEILISLHTKPDIHWKLASFCQDNGGTEMYRYKITKDSIYNALLSGWHITDIVDFLDSNSSMEVPHNIKQALQDWGSRFGKMYLMETYLICCKSKEIAKELIHTPELSPYIEGLINDKTIVITRDNHIKLITKLEKLGFMPYQEVFGSSNVPFSIMLEED